MDMAFRPHYHFTPPQNWMNDPNGLVYYNGEYHLFYQHNPYGKGWGHMSWGHAVSRDLLVWTHLPIAIMEEPDTGYTIFSGSAVIDNDEMIAVYTADYREDTLGKLETIHCAVSSDNGRTFSQSLQNPLIDVGNPKFGDPKVFRDTRSNRWIMVNICDQVNGYVMLYASDNLKQWQFLSEFHGDTRTPGMWECPDLFPLAVDGDCGYIKWVLKVNYLPAGAKLYATRYFIGEFDGTRFVSEGIVGQGLTSDDGAIYAEVTYNDAPDGRRILMGWLREEPMDSREWTGAMAIPRELSLISSPNGIALRQHPLRELDAWRSGVPVDASDLRSLESGAFEIVVVTPSDTLTEFVITVKTSNGDMHIGLDPGNAQLFWEHPSKGRISSVYQPQKETQLRIFIDEAIIEVFADEQSALTTYMPFGTVYEAVDANHAASIKVWSLNQPS